MALTLDFLDAVEMAMDRTPGPLFVPWPSRMAETLAAPCWCTTARPREARERPKTSQKSRVSRIDAIGQWPVQAKPHKREFFRL